MLYLRQVQLFLEVIFNEKMPDKKSSEANIRKLTKIGKQSIGLTLPIDAVRKLGWKERQKIKVKIDRKRIITSDWKK